MYKIKFIISTNYYIITQYIMFSQLKRKKRENLHKSHMDVPAGTST